MKSRSRLGGCKNQTTLLKKFEKLIKPIIIRRDGGRCAIDGYRHVCDKPIVVDHRPIKRKNHSTFLDPRNLTAVCSKANFLAELDALISYAIIDIVKAREGVGVIEELSIISKQPKKWSYDECMDFVLNCNEYFKTNKNGKPK